MATTEWEGGYMPHTTLTLTEFLLARIAEDEVGTLPGTVQNGVFSGIMQYYGMDESDADDQTSASELTESVMAYLQPRVLAECEAKRRIVERYENTTFDNWAEPDHEYENWILPLLVLPYADHPDYDEEWRL